MILRKVVVFSLLSLCPGVLAMGQKRALRDDLGYVHEIRRPPRRIVSLAPNITEILFALGLESRIVGVTRYCDFPPEAQEKDIIGGLVDPNVEKIQSLEPDLIIGFRGNPVRILSRLRELGLPVFVLETGSDLESVFRIIRTVGAVTLQITEAENLASSLENEYARIRAAIQGSTHRPDVFFILYGMGLWTGGKGSFIHDLVEKAGGHNIAGRSPRTWLHYNREQLIHDDPEVVIVITRNQNDFLRAFAWLKERPAYQNIQAVRTGRVYYLDENLATRPGPRLIQAYARVARILHPDIEEINHDRP